MTTTYTPILGNFSEGGIQIRDDVNDSLIPRNNDPQYQGEPRPGRLKWLFRVDVFPTMGGSEQTQNYTVPTPFKFTQEDVDKRINSLLPSVTFTGGTSNGEPTGRVIKYEPNVEDQTIRIEAYFYPGSLPDPVQIYVRIDFEHSISN